MAFIVDTYCKFDMFDRAHSIYVFEINGIQYAVKEVGMEWGLPQLGYKVDGDSRPDLYQVYSTKEEAMEFVKRMRWLAR